MREMEFKMEREGLIEIGQEIKVVEGKLPRAYYYTIQPAVAMSANIPFNEKLSIDTGIVKSIERNEKGYYVVVSFDE